MNAFLMSKPAARVVRNIFPRRESHLHLGDGQCGYYMRKKCNYITWRFILVKTVIVINMSLSKCISYHDLVK